MKKIMTLRMDQDLKKFFQKVAAEERRSLSNFIINSVLTYIKDHKGITWCEEGTKETKK